MGQLTLASVAEGAEYLELLDGFPLGGGAGVMLPPAASITGCFMSFGYPKAISRFPKKGEREKSSRTKTTCN